MSTSITITGNVTDDPRLNFTREGAPAANFTVADNSFRRDENGDWQQTDATFWDVAVFGGQVDRVAEHVTKGQRVMVTGRIHTNEWTDKSGNRRRDLRVKAEEVAVSLKFGAKNGADQESAETGDTGTA